jgi:DNA segregation ATPase FtsK/SpoIIIE-like protein
MLYSPLGAPKPIRGQGAFVSDGEVQACVDFLKQRYGALYDEDINEKVKKIANGEGTGKTEGVSDPSVNENSEDELLNAAVDVVLQVKNASVSILQRRLGVGYPRAARLIDELEKAKVIGPFEGSKPRKILITETEWLEMQARNSSND